MNLNSMETRIRWILVQWGGILGILFILSACEDSALLTFETTGGSRFRPLAMVSVDTKLEAGNYIARDHTGAATSLQVDKKGHATLFLVRVLAGSVTRWTVYPENSRSPKARVHDLGSQIVFRIGGREVVTYQLSKRGMRGTSIPRIYHRDGYLHPVRTPGGQIVTDDYPLDHLHHHGIWSAWARTIFQGRTPDFWNMGSGSGRVEVRKLNHVWNGSVYAGLNVSHDYIDMTDEEVTALQESWNLTVYSSPMELNLLDLELVQSTATDSALVFSQHRYGGVGVRGHRDWRTEEAVEFITSAGLTRENGHATRARWCHMGGLINGQHAGITVLSHPENSNAPQPMRIHPTEPFFNFAPTQTESLILLPDEPLTLNYRFITYDEFPGEDLLDALWEDYTNPLTIRIINSTP